MRILITNDDGIHASGLIPLVNWAKKLGEVVVAAPKYEQSGKSHGIEIHKAFEVKQVFLSPGVTAYAVDSTPADCVRFAVLGLKQKFDLVISGINRGFNIGSDILYSGTVGAAFEAAVLGIKALAVSTNPEYYDYAVEHMDVVYNYLVANDLFSRNTIYNINIPPRPKKILITRQGGPYFTDEFIPQENDMYLPRGNCIFTDSHNDALDTDAASHGFISIMPLTIDRTDPAVYNDLVSLNP